MRKRKLVRSRFTNNMRYKLIFTISLVGICLTALFFRTVYINAVNGDDYSIRVLNQQEYLSKTIPYKRGEILDRNGNALAKSIKVYNLIVDSTVITSSDDKYLESTISIIEKYFGNISSDKVDKSVRGKDSKLDIEKLKSGIAEKKEAQSRYWIIMKQLSYDEIKAYQEFMDSTKKDDKEKSANVKGIWFDEEYKRQYPFDSLGASVIGFLNNDGSADIGIESSYNSFLTGVNGREYGYVNSDSNMESVVKNPTNGNNIVSTIDVNIQRIVQNKIKEYKKKYKPKRMAVVVADPNSGEILAMADDTTFNLNKPRDLSAYTSKNTTASFQKMSEQDKLNSIWKNYCVSDSFEPGSTAKPFTVAAAYEEGIINRKSTFVCDGYQKVGGWRIACHKETGHGTITAKQGIAYSCNDTMMQIADKMGASLFSQYQTRFGLGFKTGIDLPGETRGIVYGADMDVTSLATNSFGQNFTVNMIQMVSGFSSLINGGYYYEPHVVKEVQTEKGNLVEDYSKSVVRQTITADTSEYIKECLRAVVTDGTGQGAAIDGYTVAGKTGTAEKVDAEKNERVKGEYIISFLGCVPSENPKVVCYSLMDSPEEQPDSTAYNVEFWKAIMKEVLPYLHIDKTEDKGKDEDLKGTKKSDITENYKNEMISGDNGSYVNKKSTSSENETETTAN